MALELDHMARHHPSQNLTFNTTQALLEGEVDCAG